MIQQRRLFVVTPCHLMIFDLSYYWAALALAFPIDSATILVSRSSSNLVIAVHDRLRQSIKLLPSSSLLLLTPLLCHVWLFLLLLSADWMPVCNNETEHCCWQESCHSEPLMLLLLPAKWQDSASPLQVVVGNLVILDPWCCSFIKLNDRIQQLQLRLMAYIERHSVVVFNVVWLLLDLLWTSHKHGPRFVLAIPATSSHLKIEIKCMLSIYISMHLKDIWSKEHADKYRRIVTKKLPVQHGCDAHDADC